VVGERKRIGLLTALVISPAVNNEEGIVAKYRKIDPRFWKDEKVTTLSTEDKTVALYLLTGQTNRIGCFSFSPALAAEDLGMSPETFKERFLNVLQTMKWDYDERLRLLYLPTWWKYNQPENPNNLTGNLKDLDDLPSSPLVHKFAENLNFLDPRFHATFHQTLRERYPKRMATQEQEQEQECHELSSTARQWLNLLNQETGRQFKPVDGNFRPIRERIREGYSLDQAEQVVKCKVAQWGKDAKMRPYLRPTSIFGPKFDSYVAEAADQDRPPSGRTGRKRPSAHEAWDHVQAGEVRL